MYHLFQFRALCTALRPRAQRLYGCKDRQKSITRYNIENFFLPFVVIDLQSVEIVRTDGTEIRRRRCLRSGYGFGEAWEQLRREYVFLTLICR